MSDQNERTSNILPSINHVNYDTANANDLNGPRQSSAPLLRIQTGANNSPRAVDSIRTTSHPLSASSAAYAHEQSGLPSPHASTSRRSTREESESFSTGKSLPSIHEALGSRSILNPLPPTSTGRPTGTSPPALAPTPTLPFPDHFSGPPNPFSHPHLPSVPSAISHVSEEMRAQHADRRDHASLLPQLKPAGIVDVKPPPNITYSYPASPRASFSSKDTNSSTLTSDASSHFPNSAQSTSYQSDAATYRPPILPYSAQPNSLVVQPTNHAYQEPVKKFEEPRGAEYGSPYETTIKRRFDEHDTEIALNETSDASLRTLEFSRYWTQRFTQANRSQDIAHGIPPLHIVDEAIGQCHRIMDSLTRVRGICLEQQKTTSEGRTEVAHLPPSDQYRGVADDYTAAGFSLADAKKRRSKAAPPGRCHSCNRAETPEWRRGPDGARTLCNACGLHYAKLTRKQGAKQNGPTTTSSLRPKGLEHRP